MLWLPAHRRSSGVLSRLRGKADRMTLLRRAPMKRRERRDCRICERRCERTSRDGGWSHVRTAILAHQPVPFATKRTPKRRSLSTRCDSMWAQIVKARGKCRADGWFVLCGGRLEATHVVPRRHRSTRWDPANGRALCRAHHRYFTEAEHEWRSFVGPEWDRLWVKAQERWSGQFPVAELTDALRLARAA